MAERGPGSAGIVCLLGLRGAGKSSLGPLLAQLLDVPFLDLDLEIARRHGLAGENIGALLERVGLDRFRELESLCLATCLAPGGPLVLATGGGVVESPANRHLLRSSSRCLWLRASLQELGRRTQADESLRPALTELDPAEELAQLAERRAPLYDSLCERSFETEGLALENLATEIFRHLSR